MTQQSRRRSPGAFYTAMAELRANDIRFACQSLLSFDGREAGASNSDTFDYHYPDNYS